MRTHVVVGVAAILAISATLVGTLLWPRPSTAGGPVLYGDVTCDGRINAVDSLFILQRDAGLIPGLPCPQNADVNGDGRTNSLDAVLVLQAVAGLIGDLGPPDATPTRTRTSTRTPTATTTPPPGDGACGVVFGSSYDEPDQFCGLVTDVRTMTAIPGSSVYDAVAAPTGSGFVVVFMTVTNWGSLPDDIGAFSLRLRDNVGRGYTMDFHEWFSAQLTAEAYFGLAGVNETIQPGLSLDAVFVFLAPQGASQFAAERCPLSGCAAQLPPPPPAACSLAFRSFFSDEDTFCGTPAGIDRMATIPASGFYDAVAAPAGSEFTLVHLETANFGYAPSYVSSFSLRLRDDRGRVFTMDFGAGFHAQLAAQSYLGSKGIDQTIQPGLTIRIVVLFVVPNGASGLSIEPCPPTGCAS